MLIFISVVILLAAFVFIYIQHPKFGKAPSGARLERMKQSPNYKDGVFENRTFTPTLTEGYSFAGVLYDFLFGKKPGGTPEDSIPSVKTDLKALPSDRNVLVWFGHSSYFLQADGLKILVDPVFSGNASPVPGSTKAFKGSDAYTVSDMPELDYLLITHDHYDHLDYETISLLKSKVKKVICGLGVGSHFDHWGYDSGIVKEMDWDESSELAPGIRLHTLTARHFSGRSFKRNTTLWLSYMLETPKRKIFMGGDSGYDTHFAAIGERFGPIDLAILENGQYNIAWHAIHCLPEETIKAAAELKTKRLMPVHSSKFSLALHPWDEPLEEVSELNRKAPHHVSMVTPMIGEIVELDDENQVFREWWKDIR
ncbi:L-ascorbate metabolism protein UlaG, beta-lactamase superfamily [Sinomicrobium oceani]|uniref:L-ascorbate metabolism protein UlaG, beta-lactamase superfamily n=1 Tax=Sinomicrobium oceani TaxID=1150368 RepID=A0A1K1PWS4_9FLAO|nr:MBL fold metallo-hydrolase [Sinomicrobium oceani]SFW51899.1 L-ascorbate metabolism protein UlaG, beta-lactamase superfamily [Sinomicrobium oceani]